MNDNPMLEAALSYARTGLPVFPLGVRSKIPLADSNGKDDATTDESQIRKRWEAHPYNIGANPRETDAIIDIDIHKSNGFDTLRAMTAIYGELPETKTALTGADGQHRWHRLPKGVKLSKASYKLGDGVELFTHGHYLVLPPSIHPDTWKAYRWLNDGAMAELPAWVIKLALDGSKPAKMASKPISELKDESRHIDLIRYIGKWRNRGFTEDEILTQALALNHDSKTPLSDDDVIAMVREYEHQSNVNDTEIPGTTLPEIIVTNRHLRDITTDALTALYKSNRPEFIFRRSGALTRISLDEKGRPFTETLNEAALRGYLARAANFVRVTVKSDKVPVPPPLDVVRDIDSLGNWQFPPLLGITESPVLRAGGTVLTEPGYDSRTNLYYSPASGLKVPPIPDTPTDHEIKDAISLALEPLADFPFDSEASRANAIATMFALIIRPLIDSPVPLAIIDKPQSGTGATLLAEVISLIATGRTGAMMPAPKSDDEWRKLIIGVLIRGQSVITIDNLESTLWSPSLAALLTATTFQGRILGRSEMVILPNRTIWLVTGNNIRLGGDLPRRCFWVRMDAQMARPWQRDNAGFKQPHLIEWVSQNRGAILSAILVIVRAWVVAGMPEAQGLLNLGGYESYCRVTGGLLAFMGIDGFLNNLEAMYSEADSETPQWEAFLGTWFDIVGEKPLTASELVSRLSEYDELRNALPDAIADPTIKNYTVRLGQELGRKNGVRYSNGFLLEKAGKFRRAITWRVVRFEKVTSH